MKYQRIQQLISFLILLLSGSSLTAGVFQEGEKKNVLLITSYHYGDTWTDNVVNGIQDILDRLSGIELYTEYMDFRRRPELEYSRVMEDYILEKYQNEKIDVIIVSDDAALELLIKLRADRFADIPLVFCGINEFREESLMGQTGIVGVNETLMIDQTLDLALQLFPLTKRVYGVATDISLAGRRNLEEYRTSSYQSSRRVQLLELLNLTTDDAAEVLSKLLKDSILLDLSGLNSPEGRQISRIQTMELMTGYSNLPVFTLWSSSMGEAGALGGVVVDGYKQGVQAGNLATRILMGDTPDSIALVTESPNVTMIDYTLMKQFSLSEKDLPLGTVKLNKPTSFYELYKKYVWFYTSLMFLLILLVLLLLYSFLQKRRAVHTIAIQEKKFRTLFENVPDYALLLEKREDGVFISDLNEAACRVHGYQREELLEQPLEVMDPESLDHDRLDSELKQIDHLGRLHHEILHHRKDGSCFPVEATVTPVEIEGRSFLFSVERDLTRQKELEQEKSELEKQIRQKHKMEAIGVLTGGIAHNFNNSLNAIIGNFELASVKNDDPSIQQYLKNGIEAAFRASGLIDQLTTYSHSYERDYSLVNLSGEIEKTLSLIRSTLPATLILTVKISEESRDKHIMADSQSIQEVLKNLYRNAADAISDKGSLTISLDLAPAGNLDNHREYSHLDKCLQLRISDTGCGISDEILEKIFDPFFSTKEVGTGIGIGLTTVKGIISQLGGTIRVRSRLQEGSTFEIYLPIAESETLRKVPEK